MSILVPWRSDDPRRVAVWEYCLRAWKEVADGADIELIAADDGHESGPFARSRAYNRAFHASTGDIVFPHGANFLPNLAALRRAAEIANRTGWSRVFTQVYNFSPEETDAILAGGAEPPIEPSRLIGVEFPATCAIARTAWRICGGYDERFGRGYGYEDAAMRNNLAHHFGVNDHGHSGVVRILDHGLNLGAARIDPANERLFWGEYANLAPELN